MGLFLMQPPKVRKTLQKQLSARAAAPHTLRNRGVRELLTLASFLRLYIISQVFGGPDCANEQAVFRRQPARLKTSASAARSHTVL